MSDLRKRTAFLLIDHRRVFNQNPSKRALMDHIKALQDRVDILEKIAGRTSWHGDKSLEEWASWELAE